jgi:hypothetical protein
MPKTGIIDELAAHRALHQLPEVWLDLAHGRLAGDAAIASATAQEPRALVERTARMLTPPTVAQRQARLHALLEASATVELRPVARPRRWLYGSVVALVAAAMVLLVVMPRQPLPTPFDAGYELELGRGLASERDVDAAAAVPRYRMDRTVELVLRPSRRVTEALDVRAFGTRGDDPAITLPIEPRINPAGVVEILGQPRAWGLGPGRWRLTLVVGPAAGLPHALTDLEPGPDAPYEVREAWIDVLEEAAPAP